MGLEIIEQDLRVEAESRAAQLRHQAGKQAEEILSRVKEDVRQYQKERQQHTTEMLELQERKILAAAEFEAQRQIQQKRTVLFDQLLQQVRKKIVSLDEMKRKVFLSKLLERASRELEVATVFVNQRDLRLIGGNTTVKTTEIEGGLLAETKDGRISVNLSVEELLDMLRTEYIVEIGKGLFL